MVNLLSALLSAGCIFFLFLTITHLTRKLVAPQDGLITTAQVISIEASGLVGALVYTFSDTFWFSAVEAEVYAFSSFLTALLFWLILKWESEADDPRSDRWIVLIAYITGLSIGVHLLCLLCLPAMSFVVYYRKTSKVTWLGSLKTLLIGALLVALILYGIIPGVIWLGSRAELLFTNQLGCPYHTGLICCLLLMAIWLYFLRHPIHTDMEANAEKGPLGRRIGHVVGAAFPQERAADESALCSEDAEDPASGEPIQGGEVFYCSAE